MPLLEDYGTLTGVSIGDRWTLTNMNVTKYANRENLAGAGGAAQLDASFHKFPFYWSMKCCRIGITDSNPLYFSFFTGNCVGSLRIYKTYIEDFYSGQKHYMDVETPFVLMVYLPKEEGPGRIFVDGVDVLPFTSDVAVQSSVFLIALWVGFLDSFDIYFQRIHTNPVELIDYLWLTFLRARVMDPADRDDPADFIKQRYPVETFPTEIQKPIIDFFISHRPRPRFHPSFPHTYLASEVTINAYVGIDYEFEGLKNVSLLNSMMSLIVEALGSVYDDIPVLRNYTFSSPRFFLDERNKAWRGVLKVTADHFVEVF